MCISPDRAGYEVMRLRRKGGTLMFSREECGLQSSGNTLRADLDLKRAKKVAHPWFSLVAVYPAGA